MWYGISALCFVLAGYCGFLSLSDRMQFGAWYPPHFTIGHLFGLDEHSLGSLGLTIAHVNSGWLFFAASLLIFTLAVGTKR